jgi:glycosyltransferase involved in cell wall biosynthesis
MFKLFSLQSKRLKNLHSYDAVLTYSDHMLAELMKHGLSPQRAYNIPNDVQSADESGNAANLLHATNTASSLMAEAAEHESVVPQRAAEGEWRLLFLGRMEYLKGGHVFLDALPIVAAALDKPLLVTFAGDGRLRRNWERQAARLQERYRRIEVKFIGWADRSRIDSLLEDCDLLVVPSLWPEPFGLVGPEAGSKGVPVAAFAVGGIADWLADGINGYLALGDPATSEGLAEAIVRCLRDPLVHARLRRGAMRLAERFNIKNHLAVLLDVFEGVTRSPQVTPKTSVALQSVGSF